MSIARYDPTKLDAHKKVAIAKCCNLKAARRSASRSAL